MGETTTVKRRRDGEVSGAGKVEKIRVKIWENHSRCPKNALDFDRFEWENHGKITLDALKIA